VSFRDRFAALSSDYARYRPRYPERLFAYLASLTAGRGRAWDCATGSGQAALGLTPYFRQVIATDPSEWQISNAVRHEKIVYVVSGAGRVEIESGSVDLVTVAQALHWLPHDEFYKEVRRVLRPEGIIAAWGYSFIRGPAPVQKALEEFHEEVIKPLWLPENRLSDEGFVSLPFPFEELTPPPMTMEARWDLNHLAGFLSSWTVVQRYKEQQGVDVVEPLLERLRPAWGDPGRRLRFSWPIKLRVGGLRRRRLSPSAP
jgi:SAM-dependent methyltransferase